MYRTCFQTFSVQFGPNYFNPKMQFCRKVTLRTSVCKKYPHPPLADAHIYVNSQYFEEPYMPGYYLPGYIWQYRRRTICCSHLAASNTCTHTHAHTHAHTHTHTHAHTPHHSLTHLYIHAPVLPPPFELLATYT